MPVNRKNPPCRNNISHPRIFLENDENHRFMIRKKVQNRLKRARLPTIFPTCLSKGGYLDKVENRYFGYRLSIQMNS